MNALITLILSLLAIGHATARLEGSADSFHRILAPPFCGDNDCKGSETCESCPEDCGCATGETCAPGGSCVSGCTDECCDDSQCDDGNGCTLDQCIDGTCDNTGDACVLAGGTCDAGSCISCGDGTCNGSEDCASCPTDCGTCTNPNCSADATSCVCWEDSTPTSTTCSYDQDCPSTVTEVPGTCAGGRRDGLECASSLNCPKGNGYADCLGGGTTTVPAPAGSCRGCPGVQVSGGLISGDINQCTTGSLCGDFHNNVNPVDCVSCLTDMTCHDWCNLDVLGLSSYLNEPLDSYTANSNCGGSGYDNCTCTMSSWLADSWTISSNTHPGAICDAHRFDKYGDCSVEGWCLADFPNGDYCNSLKVTAITGQLNEGVCTCSAKVTSDFGDYEETKEVWSSECIENIYYTYDIGPDGNGTETSGILPCSFTG